MSRSSGESALEAGKMAHGAILAPGTLLGKYQIVRPLGAGGMAAVYEALHTGIGKAVAIKALRALATDPHAEARFLREAAAASRLDHPHVVDVTDYGTEEGLSFIVMELLRGEDFGEMIARDPGTLEPAFVADILLAVCAGVFAAHESGVIHRDLKPANIFLARTPLGELVPKVLDFGISKLLDEEVGAGLTGSGALVGTTHYLSPEQVAGKTLDVRADQYALGVILYEALTGRRPHEGDTPYLILRSIGEGSFALPRTLRPDIPSGLEAVVLRALSRRPQDRFESVHDLGRVLLPHASPKRRVIWSDYYERGRPPVSPLAPPSYPDPPRPPVEEGGTVAIDAFRAKRGDRTQTRMVEPPARAVAATRIAAPLEIAAASLKAAGPGGRASAAPVPPPAGAPRSRLRPALLVGALLIAAAGGYGLWKNPGFARRVPGQIQAGVARALPSAHPAEPTPTPGPPGGGETRARAIPAETRVILGEPTGSSRGGLLPPTPSDREALSGAVSEGTSAGAGAAGLEPDAGPSAPAAEVEPEADPAVDPESGVVTGAPGGSSPPRPGPASRARGAVEGAEVRDGTVAPYAPGDATRKALRLLKGQRRSEGFGQGPRAKPGLDNRPAAERVPSGSETRTLSPSGFPILE